MKKHHLALAIVIVITSCTAKVEDKTSDLRLTGTWKLVRGTLIEKGDTTITDYTKDKSFIKIINDTHFAFLLHDLNKGTDSSAVFTAGGGRYELKDSTYIEHLEYCTARNWEGHDFTFTMALDGDKLVQKGVEKIEDQGIDRLNIEEYIRMHE